MIEGDFFSRALAEPDRVVLVMAETGASITAGELARNAIHIATWLDKLGLAAGDRFAVLLENRFEIPAFVYAARYAGMYAILMSTHSTPAEVAYVVRDSGAKLLIVSERTASLASDLGDLFGVSCWTVDDSQPGAASLKAALSSVEGPPPDFSSRPLGRDLLYSSGTTGRPKGVFHAMLPASFRGQTDPEALVMAGLMGFDEHTVYLSTAPLYHAAPLRFSMRILDLGGRVVIMDRFDASAALSFIERYKITHSQWVPTMFRRLLGLPAEIRQRHDLSSHRMAIHAAAPCPVDVKFAMLEWWGDMLFEYYAGSEGCGITVVNSEEWRRRPGTVGRPTTTIVHIVGDHGQELPAGEIGHIYFEGGGAFSYFNDEEKTKAAFNEKGWATYGDMGYLDAEGYLFLSSRRADLILSGGVNLYPQEIEDSLALHPNVSDVAVVGVPHVELGEVPLAVAVLAPGVEKSAETALAIIDEAAKTLGRLKLPRRMVFVEELPRLATGKLLRRKVKDEYRTEPDAGFDLRSAKKPH